VVQVGAFSDPNTLRQARAKVERLGLRTYTQVIGSGSIQRTRVRVGPFASRADAEAAAGKLKAGGLPADILKL
jgi:DedD protein